MPSISQLVLLPLESVNALATFLGLCRPRIQGVVA